MALTVQAQEASQNSNTRAFIESAEITKINRDWTKTAEFKSGLGEFVKFYPVEAINLKSNESMRAIQVEMAIQTGGELSNSYFKMSWIDLDEIRELKIFMETYVIPALNDRANKKQSTTYIFNSKELVFDFHIERNRKRVSIFLKDHGVVDNYRYFWTESQVNNIPRLLEMLNTIDI